MDVGDLDFPCEQLLDMTNSSSSFDIDDFFPQAQSCTHAHACSPPGPDKTHTHTCIHVHTQIMPEAQHASDDTSESAETKAKKRPSGGNREAVRKYRERKKAKAASLEDEVVKLRALNGQLVKKLQNQALLEAEVSRLKCLLVDIRGRIEGEIGSFPYGKMAKSGDVGHTKITNTNNNTIAGSYVMNSCNVQCDDQLDCLWHGLETAGVRGQGLRDCELGDFNCLGNEYGNSSLKEVTDFGAGYVNNVTVGNNSNSSRRKSGACSARAC